MTTPTTASDSATLSMGRVALTVHDLDRMRDFYERTMGLHPIRSDGESAELGVGSDVLLELRRDRAARRRSPRDAGLFHTAFLLPDRADLARWTREALNTGAPLTGASDHAVSEALYLNDPEGNGIEIYIDRPSSSWDWADGMVHMVTDPLDMDDLLAQTAGMTWAGMPEGAIIGHVHLQVGAIAAAENFYAGHLGLDVTSRYPGATFYAADGYHHHIATNIWNSRGAAERSFPSTGLAEVQIRLDAARADALRARAGMPPGGTQITLRDPWGTPVVLNVISKGKI